MAKQQVKVRKKKKMEEVEQPGSIKNELELQKYQDDVVMRGRAGETKTPKGTEKHTMLLSTQTFDTGTEDERTYIVPRHDPKTKKEMTDAEATKKWMPKIREGKVTGYRTVGEAESDLRTIRKRVLENTPTRQVRRPSGGKTQPYAYKTKEGEAYQKGDEQILNRIRKRIRVNAQKRRKDKS